MFSSIKSVREFANSLQLKFDLDMGIDKILSDGLNNYFRYSYDKDNDVIKFFFELETGPCMLKVHNPYTDNVFYKFNDTLKDHFSLRLKTILNT